MSTDRSAPRRFALSTVAGAGVLALLTACGEGDTAAISGHDGMTRPPAVTASPRPETSANQADVMFAQMMIPHHRQAVEMAELAATRAADPEVKDLAAKIKAAQDPEIVLMRGWLAQWGAAEMPAVGEHAGHGMMTDEDMAELRAAKGAAFDRMFTRMMIEHHDGAIDMARTQRARGADPKVKDLAEAIISAQRAEIEQMRKLLKRL